MSTIDRSPALNLIGVAAACGLLYVFRSVLAPFVIAFVIAIVVDSLLRSRMLPKTRKRPVRLVAGALLGGAVILGGARLLIHGAREATARIPGLIERLNHLTEAAGRTAGLEGPVNLDALAGNLDMSVIVGKLAASLQGAMSGTLLTVLFLVFILASKSLIQAKLRMVTAPTNHGLAVIERTIRGVETYVWTQTVTGAMFAAASGAIMFAVGLDNPLFWAVVLFMLSYIPFLGVAVGSVAPALFALDQFPTIWPALCIFLGVQTVSFLVGNLVLPKMQAESQNIDPAMSLLATGIWTVLWGAPGAFLAVPLTLGLMFQLAQYESLRWMAVLISNNGDPLGEDARDGEHSGDTTAAEGQRPLDARGRRVDGGAVPHHSPFR